MLFLNEYFLSGMSTVKILKYIFALSVISFSTVSLQAKAESFHNIPDELLAKAVSSEVVYDEEFDYYTCDVNLDEDEAVRFMQGSFDDCSFFDPYDEYKIVRKQN